MKKCTGHSYHPSEPIKYIGDWCPLCAMALTVQHRDNEIVVLKKCVRYSRAIKPSRRLPEYFYETSQED